MAAYGQAALAPCPRLWDLRPSIGPDVRKAGNPVRIGFEPRRPKRCTHVDKGDPTSSAGVPLTAQEGACRLGGCFG
jgi:hypothetical protein